MDSGSSSNHLVQFYDTTDNLIAGLDYYIFSGLRAGENCLVIATPDHLEQLTRSLRSKINVNKYIASGKLIKLDAAELMDKFIVNGMPDERLFKEHVGELVSKIFTKGNRLRAYGEMVAILWKSGNGAGVLKLEELWNKLIKDQDISLYCAYPELHFVMDGDMRREIQKRHAAQHIELQS